MKKKIILFALLTFIFTVPLLTFAQNDFEKEFNEVKGKRGRHLFSRK